MNGFSELFFIYAVFVYMFTSDLSLIFFINVYFFYKCLFTQCFKHSCSFYRVLKASSLFINKTLCSVHVLLSNLCRC